MRADATNDRCDIVLDLQQRGEREPIVAAFEMSQANRHFRQLRADCADADRAIRNQVASPHETLARSTEEVASDLALAAAERIEHRPAH